MTRLGILLLFHVNIIWGDIVSEETVSWSVETFPHCEEMLKAKTFVAV